MRLKGWVFTVSLCLVLAACSSGSELVQSEVGPGVDTTLPSGEGLDQLPDSPQTGGVTAADPLQSKSAVKVGNGPSAVPQWGLLGIVGLIELPAEGGITRLIALFDGPPPRIGPVRSARPVDADLVAPFAELVVTSGGQEWVLRQMLAAGLQVVTPESSPASFERVDRPTPSNLAFFGSVGEGDPRQGFAAGGSPTGTTIESLRIPYSSSQVTTYRWSGTSFIRYQNGAEHLVLSDLGLEPTPLVFDSVVVLMVEQRSAGYTDSAGAPVPTFDVIGSGTGYLLADGVSSSIVWSRPSFSRSYLLTDDAGNAVAPSGVVAIQLVPMETPVEISG